MKNLDAQLTIAAVERELGLSKDVLRVWERRYGFPVPSRSATGERLYPIEQVLRLRLVKRLMDQGFRPGRLLKHTLEELENLATQDTGAAPVPPGDAQGLAELLGLVRTHDATGLLQTLQKRLAQGGLEHFVLDTIAPMSTQVGHEWARGGIEVFEEHLFTEVAARLMRQAIATVPPGAGPTVLLTTVADEPHGLGLLMVESLLALRGARSVSLGTQTPLLDIARAAQAHRADVVALSFSAAFNPRRIPALLQQLRAALASPMQLWAGGAAVSRVPAIEGVQLLGSLQEAVSALQAWHASQG